jgi:nucleoside-diphosphate-sugar epimerase
MVYGGSGSVTAQLFLSAEEEGASVYVGDGENRWSMVHREDLARLYRMIVEARAPGVFHGVDDHPVRLREAARAASMAAGAAGATRRLPLEEARASMGPMADALVMDQWLVARRAADLGWAPERASFVEEAAAAYEELKATRES